MKFILSILCLSILFIGCQPKPDNSAKEAFEKNSATVKANVEGFMNESIDYSMYADDFVMRGTGANSSDSLSLDDVKKNDKELWADYDFKLLDELVLLPGVNSETKEMDGSVRYYGNWEITIPATDSTEARSEVLKYYESFDFDEEGKILFQQGYGDFGGVWGKLHQSDKDDSEEAPEE